MRMTPVFLSVILLSLTEGLRRGRQNYLLMSEASGRWFMDSTSGSFSPATTSTSGFLVSILPQSVCACVWFKMCRWESVHVNGVENPLGELLELGG